MLSTAKDGPQPPSVLPSMKVIVNEGSELQKAIGYHVKNQLISLGIPTCEVINLSQVSSPPLEQPFFISLLEIYEPFFLGINEENYKGFQDLIKSKPGLLWVTQGGGQTSARPEADMITGLSRCLRSENDNLRLITLALETSKHIEGVALHITNIIRTTFRKSPEQCEVEYEERNGRLYIPRTNPANSLNDHLLLKDLPQKPQRQEFGYEGRALKLNVHSPGLLDTMEYIEDLDCNRPLARGEVELKVKAVGVNFKDILIALGRLSEGGLGNECAGTVTRAGSETDFVPGDRVCVGALGTYKTYVRSKATMVFNIPKTMSFVEAAALPMVHSTAYHTLYEKARLAEGESVLIHSGAGGTGQAAIQLAKLRAATIFVTVGLEEKKKLLIDLYAIPEDHIFSSRGMSFVKGINRMTKGRGVDVILNSLAGESLHCSWECLAPFGRFIEIGKNDILQGNKLSMFPFNENRTFAAVNLTHIMSERPAVIKHIMEAVLALFEENRITTPRPLHIFSNSKIEEAFRYIQGGQNTGKTILELNDEDLVSVVPSPQPTYSFAGDKTFIIAGGLGGLGRCIVRWMVGRGAKHIILLSRSGAKENNAKDFLNEVQAAGANVAAPACDISDETSLLSVLAEYAHRMPQIKGCIQSTMVLKDAIFEKMSLTTFNSAIKPKVNGSWNLHKHLPQNLEFFIMLSSTCGITGVRGQANYASGNTFQDALARHRVAKGQKAISLDLGWIVSSGYVAERPEVAEAMRKLGYPPLSEEDLLSLLDYHCDPHLPLASPSDCRVITGMDTPARLREQNIEEPYWMRRSMFRVMHQMGNNASFNAANRSTNAVAEYAALLSCAKSVAEAAEIIKNGLVRKLSRILSVPEEEIDASQAMHTMGVDSLVAVEIRNWFAKEIGADLMIFEILGNESITDLSHGVAARNQFG